MSVSKACPRRRLLASGADSSVRGARKKALDTSDAVQMGNVVTSISGLDAQSFSIQLAPPVHFPGWLSLIACSLT